MSVGRLGVGDLGEVVGGGHGDLGSWEGKADGCGCGRCARASLGVD